MFNVALLAALLVPQALAYGGYGDPHMVGFDNAKFDFHGLHNRHYAMIGRTGGDMLVAKMRSAGPKDTSSKQTYFHEFGLQPAGSARRVRVALLFSTRRQQWTIGAYVDGKPFPKGLETRSFRVGRSNARKFTVRTAEMEYRFLLMWPTKHHDAHLNLQLKLLRDPRASDEFRGLLGLTLNKQLGRETDAHLKDGVPVAVREQSLIERFSVNSMFPPHDTLGDSTPPSVRAAVSGVKGLLAKGTE